MSVVTNTSQQATTTAPRLPIEVLRQAGLLGSLTDPDARHVAAALRPIRHEFLNDEYLCRSGDAADRMWIVGSGQVRIVEPFGDQAGHLTSRQPGEILGEIAYLRSERVRSASMIAQGPIEVWEIEFGRIDALESQPTLLLALLKAISRTAADKFAAGNRHRAELSAKNDRLARDLRKFVPRHALGSSRTVSDGLRAEYLQEHAVYLFSDIVGFSDIAETRSPMETASLLKRVLDAQGAAIGQASGEIDKFIGDAVMAFWIVGGVADAERRRGCSAAFAAALKIVDAVAAIENPLDGSPIQIRLGLHIGPSYSGDFGATDRSAFTFIGKEVNLAARLEQVREDHISGGHGKDGLGKLGPVRVSSDFYQHLTQEEQLRLPHESVVQVKHTTARIFSSSVIR